MRRVPPLAFSKMPAAWRCGAIAPCKLKLSCFPARKLYVIVYDDDVQFILKVFEYPRCYVVVVTRCAMQKVADAHIWQEMVLDMLVEENHNAAKVMLEDLRLYPDLETLEIESSDLTDEDLMTVDHVASTVRYLNLRGNSLHCPWIFLTTKFPNVSDTILGLATMIDGLQLRLERQSTAIVNASHQVTKLARMPLPKEAFFGAKNVHQQWIIPEKPPFKRQDLKALLRSWVPNARTPTSDFATLTTDFARHYFVVACEPPTAIQKYSLRVSSRGGKKEELQDLPERIVSALVEFMLEAMGIGQPELGRTAEELVEHPTQFWLALGKNDVERGAALDYRKTCRMSWTPTCRVSVAKALDRLSAVPHGTGTISSKTEATPRQAAAGGVDRSVIRRGLEPGRAT
ncbi:hypothetical protein Y032_0146g2558 [Ancylostoma ceylanicum]|uniref:Uncharacterized protein n=1 Tax=Ancylostoma ceylanicum TaxID=53326 RepID=A0A016T1K3_9BILA|nr:hypothetical protein Y032_0146g2558 [Ancylostoma ceylanicum]